LAAQKAPFAIRAPLCATTRRDARYNAADF
jgi:hypothetical protein